MKQTVRSRIVVIASGALAITACTAAPERTAYQQLIWPVTEAEFLAALPADVLPESRGRIPIVDRDSLNEDRKKAYDRRVDPNTTSLAGIYGPGGLTLNGSPSLPDSLDESLVDKRTQELMRLVVSREMSQQLEWTVHEPVGLANGLEPEIIDVIRHRKPTTGLPAREAALIDWGRELFQDKDVSSETFARLIEHVSKRDIVDLCYWMGNYTRTAFLLHTFDVHLPYDREPLLTMP